MGKVLSTVATTLVVLFAAAIVAVIVVIPRVTGGATLAVLSGSMEPTIPTGAAIVIRPVEDPLTLEVGDVITYQAAPGVRQLITHRIIERQPQTTPPSYRTQGDANGAPDIQPVPVGAIRGKVWFHVPYLGHLTTAFNGQRGGMALASVVLIGVIIDRVGAIRRALREDREGGGATPATPSAPPPPPVVIPDTSPSVLGRRSATQPGFVHAAVAAPTFVAAHGAAGPTAAPAAFRPNPFVPPN